MNAPESLDYITIKGFKSIASIELLELRPVNVLIGANGSGKSNFIDVFSFLNRVRDGRLREYVATRGGAERLLHFGSKVTPKMSFMVSFAQGNSYELNLLPSDGDALAPSHEAVYTPIGVVYSQLGSWRVFHLHDTSSSSLMRKTGKLHDNDFLRPDGSNLAAFLYLLQERYPDSYRLIRQTIQQVAPFFDDFQLRPLNLNPDDIKLEWRHRDSDQYFDAASLSDGTLRFMVLATLFLQPAALRPSTILVDEPELGLHPAAIELLASLIGQASAKTQVIVSTESSLLLDHFEPEDILVAGRVNGGTTLTRLNRASLAEWLEDYSLGQLWEKNELGGCPRRD